MPVERSLAIRLSLKDAEAVRAALKAVGAEGAAALAAIERQSDPTSRALEAVRNRAEPMRRTLQQAERDVQTLNAALAAGKISAEEYALRLGQIEQRAQEVGRAGGAAAQGFQQLSAVLGPLGIALSATFAVQKVKDFLGAVVEAGDTVARLQGRFTALTGSTGAAAEAVGQVFAITQKTGASVDDTGKAFTRFYIASQSIGATRAEAARLVETVQKLGIIGGATTQEMAAGAQQLGQALASGKLAGDEFRSITENLPLVAKALADQLGVSAGKLREMSKDGELTAEKVFGALEKRAKDVDKQFAAMPVTVERAAGQAAAAWTQFAAEIDRSIGLSRTLASVLQGIANTLASLGKPRTGLAILEGMEQQIATLQKQADQQRQMGLEGQARRIEANIAQMRQGLDVAREMANEESVVAAKRWVSEQATVAQTKAAAAATEAAKKQADAYEFLNKALPKEGALQKYNEQVSRSTKLFSDGLISYEQHVAVLKDASKEYDDAIKKADRVKTSVDSVGNAFKNQLAALTDSTAALAGYGEVGAREFARLTDGATKFTAAQVARLTAARNLNEAAKAAQTLNKSSVALGTSITGRQVEAEAAAYLKAVDVAGKYEGTIARLTAAIRERGEATTDGIAAQKLLEETEKQAADATKQVGETLGAVTRKRDEELAKLGERVAAAEDQNEILRLEATGSKEAARAIDDLRMRRAVERIEVEKRAALGPIMARLATDEVKASETLTALYQEQADAVAAYYDRLKAAESTRPLLDRAKRDAEAYAQELQRTVERATDRIVDFGADAMFDVMSGKSRDFWEDFKELALRAFAQIAAEAVLRPLVAPLVSAGVGAVMGGGSGGGALGSASSGASLLNSLSGGSLFKGVGDALGLTNLFGTGGGFLGLPTLGTAFQTIGGTLGIGSGVATGTLASTISAGSAVSAEIGAAALGSAAAPGLMASLASVALPAALIAAPFLLGGLFNRKPSNQGAEVSFNLDDYSDFFRSTKHENRVDQVDAYTPDLQELLRRSAQRYGVEYGAGAVVGSTFGKAEGSRFFFDAGDRDGGIENRVYAGFTEGDEASTKAAAEKVVVAAIRDGFAAAEDDEGASQSAKDLGVAMRNSAAETFADLDLDIVFAQGFDTFARLGSGAITRVQAATEQLQQKGETAAKAIGEQGRTWLANAERLGLGTEELEDGSTRAEAAMRGYVRELLLGPPAMDDMTAATIEAEQFTKTLTEELIDLGFSATEAAELAGEAGRKFVADAQATLDRLRISNETASLNRYNQAVYGSNYIEPADSFLYGLVGDKYTITAGGGPFAPLVAALNATREGKLTGLNEVFARVKANTDKKVFDDEEAAAVEEYATRLYTQAQARLARQNPGTESAPADAAGDGGSGSTDDEREARDDLVRSIQDEIDGRREAEQVQEAAAREAERLAQTFGRMAQDLREFREGLLLGPTSPLSPEAQLAEAQRQEADALARVLAGGEDAPDAARELTTAAARVQELARTVYGSTAQSNAIFNTSLQRLGQAEGKALSVEAQQLAAAETANGLLVGIRQDLARLGDELERARATGTGSPSGGTGTPDGGTPTPIPSPGTLYSFGFTNLGRGANETAADFLSRMFPKVAAQLAPGGISEQEGYDWAQAQHASGIGITNAAYYAAARKGGYLGVFTGWDQPGGQKDWLSPGGTPVMARWTAFIDQLRLAGGDVPFGFFGVPYARGGEIPHVPGLTRPGVDSFPGWLTPGELVVPEPLRDPLDQILTANSAWPAVVGELRQGRGTRDRALERIEAHLGMIERQMGRQADEMGGLRRDLQAVLANRDAVGARKLR